MIPTKLVETIFQRIWLLALPIVLVPLAVVALTRPTPVFESRATVWVSSPVGDAQPSLGHNNQYLTPAENQVSVLTDLLATETFRGTVALKANIVDANTSAESVRLAIETLDVGAYSSGVNLVGISARADSAERAQAIVAATVEAYSERGIAEIEREAKVSATYYQQQLDVAQRTLESRKGELAAYLRANPKAADPTQPASLDLNYRALVSQVEQQSNLVDSLVQSLQGVELRQAAAPENQLASFDVQDPPSLPHTALPVSPTALIGLPFAGLIFGLLLAATYVYFTYRTDHTIRTTADLVGLAVPVLGSVPDLRQSGRLLRHTPIGWVVAWRNRDFARRTAASITEGERRPASDGVTS